MNYRHFTACLIVLAGVVCIVPTFKAWSISGPALSVAGQTPPPPQTPAVTQLDGRLHPESIPPEIAWEHFFRAMVSVGFDTLEDAEPRADIVEPLSKYNLLIPPTQVRTVLRVSQATIAKVEALRRPFDQEGQGKIHLGWTKEQRQSVLKEIGITILAGRDALVEQLPRNDMLAVDRYLAKNIIPPIKTRIIK
jgi:hypothetical protein